VTGDIDLLETEGPALGRPTVDRVKGSTFHSMKELRPAGTSIRILFIFDRDLTNSRLPANSASSWREVQPSSAASSWTRSFRLDGGFSFHLLTNLLQRPAAWLVNVRWISTTVEMQ